jgi:hypothetical protein
MSSERLVVLPSFELASRVQFTFTVDDIIFATLLNLLVKSTSSGCSTIPVNIVGFSIQKTGDGCDKSLVRMIVGPTDPGNLARGGAGPVTNPDRQRDYASQVLQMTHYLKQLEIDYTTQEVIQIFNLASAPGIPGTYRIPYTTLVTAKIPVLASYVGEGAYTPGPIPLKYGSRTVTYRSEPVSVFFEVPKCQVEEAMILLRNIRLTTPFLEGQLIINRDNAEKLAKC